MVTDKFDELWRIVGNSPMLAIHYRYKDEERTVYAKSEHFNITGSIKDRMALYILQKIAASRPDVFLPCQFSNEGNIEAHQSTTGKEIWWQMNDNGIVPGAFIAGVGTGGTVMGVGSYLKSMNPSIKVYPLEPAESPTLSTGHKVGSHRIQGISDEFIPEIVKLDQLDEVVEVSDGDSIIMAQRLASELGLAVGISSGANFIGAVKIQNKLGNNVPVVTTFSDSNKKYLSTDLMRDEPVKPGYLSSEIELLEYRVFKRVCKVNHEGVFGQ